MGRQRPMAERIVGTMREAEVLIGAKAGAAIGTAFAPGIGTIIGGILGGLGGALFTTFASPP